MKTQNLKLLGIAAAVGMGLLSTHRVMATMETFQMVNGDVGDSPYTGNFTVVFNTTTNQIQVTFNNTSTMHAANELIYGVTFTVNNHSISATPTISGISGSEETATNSSYSYTTVTSNSSLSRPWQTSVGGGNVYSLTGNSGDDLVITAPDASGDPYPDANSSVFNHVPFITTGSTFTLDINGVTAAMMIDPDSVSVEYGTNPDGSRAGTLVVVVPEPASLGLMFLGSLALLAKRRKKA